MAVAVAAVAYLAAGGHGGASAGHSCASTGSPFGPFEIQTYEAADYRNLYADTFDLAGYNELFPEHGGFTTPNLETGGRSAGSSQKVAPYIPPVLLKSIGFLESGWAQASYDPLVQYGEVGPVLASHDCGYGIMQITSGMQNISGVTNLDQAMIGSHYAFNIARGAKILAEKWNSSPEYRPIVGQRNPELIEDWYYALWGYNGFAFSNHPLNPSYQPTRVAFSCGPPGDGYGHDRTQYPYQELVLGCAERPPIRSGEDLWQPQDVHLPDLSDPAFANPLNVGNWNPCSFSLDCAAMDMPTPNPNHEDSTQLNVSREEVIGEPVLSLPSTGVTHVKDEGGSDLALKFFWVENTGSGVLGYQVTSNASWITASPAAGVALGPELGGERGLVSLTINMGGMSQESYTGKVTIKSLYAQNATKTFTVNVVVGEAPTGIWGDNNCSQGAPDATDALLALRHDAGFSTDTSFCPEIGGQVGGHAWGDVNCDGNVNSLDSLYILRFDSGKPVTQQPGCPVLGSSVTLPA